MLEQENLEDEVNLRMNLPGGGMGVPFKCATNRSGGEPRRGVSAVCVFI